MRSDRYRDENYEMNDPVQAGVEAKEAAEAAAKSAYVTGGKAVSHVAAEPVAVPKTVTEPAVKAEAAVEPAAQTQAGSDVSDKPEAKSKGLFKRKEQGASAADGEDVEQDLTKLKKTELLEIMLAQGKEIDRLNERIAELEAQLESRELEFSRIGSIAEASLAVTDIFKEAEKAAIIYLENVRRRCEQKK